MNVMERARGGFAAAKEEEEKLEDWNQPAAILLGYD